MKRPSFRSNISRWIKIYHSINIVSRNIDRSIEARWFLTSMIARWMKAFSSRLRLDLIEFQLRRRKFRGGPPRYLIFLRRFRMRVRRGLKGTPRVTTFLGHRLTNEKREKFVFFFFYILLLLLPRENTMDRPREIINYYYYRARRRDS